MFRFRRKKRSSDPLAVVQRFVDAANRHDAQGVADCLHADFDSVQPVYPSRNFRGSEQVRRNWQAIFKSEPGFRLTLLRSARADDTVWVELHGAGREAEVAGVFIMGVENDLIRWGRVYSAVVDQELYGPSDVGEQAPPMVVDDGVSDARVAAELREMVDAGRARAAAAAPPTDGAPDDTAFAPEPEPAAALAEDSLGTGEHPVAVVDGEGPEPEEEELVAVVGPDPVAADEPEPAMAADEPEPEPEPEPLVTAGEPEPEPEPLVTADEPEPEPAMGADEGATADETEERRAVEVSLEDLLGPVPPPEPPPPDTEPVVELVRPAAPSPAGEERGGPDDEARDEGDESPLAEPAALELKPERRFQPPLRRP